MLPEWGCAFGSSGLREAHQLALGRRSGPRDRDPAVYLLARPCPGRWQHDCKVRAPHRLHPQARLPAHEAEQGAGDCCGGDRSGRPSVQARAAVHARQGTNLSLQTHVSGGPTGAGREEELPPRPRAAFLGPGGGGWGGSSGPGLTEHGRGWLTSPGSGSRRASQQPWAQRPSPSSCGDSPAPAAPPNCTAWPPGAGAPCRAQDSEPAVAPGGALRGSSELMRPEVPAALAEPPVRAGGAPITPAPVGAGPEATEASSGRPGHPDGWSGGNFNPQGHRVHFFEELTELTFIKVWVSATSRSVEGNICNSDAGQHLTVFLLGVLLKAP